MTEQELRTLVQDAIARYAGASVARAGVLTRPAAAVIAHSSHGMFSVPAGADADGPCLIEPAVACNHCGYCQSYGH